ncbi:hypothetical protein U3516DRAFT_757945 [Neocallimastix sp. 'constans']
MKQEAITSSRVTLLIASSVNLGYIILDLLVVFLNMFIKSIKESVHDKNDIHDTNFTTKKKTTK